MKKIITVILAVAMLLTLLMSFCSCSARKCDFCGTPRNTADMRKSEVEGNTYYMCDDCYHELEESIFADEHEH